MPQDPTMQMYWRLSVADARGRVLRKGRWRKSRSFVANYLTGLLSLMSAANRGVTDVNGSGASVPPSTAAWTMDAVAGSLTKGGVLGTGTAAVAINQDFLSGLIVEGTGAGQMAYQAVTFVPNSSVTVSGSAASFLMRRVVNNNSGGPITINEVGLHSRWSTFTILMVRDLQVPGLVVPDGGVATLEYTLRVAV